MQITSRIVAREFKSGDRPHLYAGTPALEALIAPNHKETFSIMHTDVEKEEWHTRRSMLGSMSKAVEHVKSH